MAGGARRERDVCAAAGVCDRGRGGTFPASFRRATLRMPAPPWPGRRVVRGARRVRSPCVAPPASGRLALIDFDRCALADPAFDVGKFLADLHWLFTACGQDGLEQAQEQFIAGYAPGEPAERLLRARLYEAVELVQMTVLRARLF